MRASACPVGMNKRRRVRQSGIIGLMEETKNAYKIQFGKP
jgi:hypothetical protein